MGKISVVFVTALTCIFLICQISQAESTTNSDETITENLSGEFEDKSSSSSNEDNGDDKHEHEAGVRSLQCDGRICTATVGKKCRIFHGNSVTVQFTLEPSSEKLKNPLVRNVTCDGKAKLELKGLDLLPFTKYTVTASLANTAGAKQASFITKPEKPGRVSSLAVTQSTPSSLHVVWTAPDDHPPKGKLSQYRLEWRILGGTTNAGSKIVNESVTSFIITGLYPTTIYEITIAAKNADNNEYGEGVSVTNITKEEGAYGPRTGTDINSTNTTIHFSWYESASGSGKPADYYRVTYSHGDERAENTTTNNTDITVCY